MRGTWVLVLLLGWGCGDDGGGGAPQIDVPYTFDRGAGEGGATAGGGAAGATGDAGDSGMGGRAGSGARAGTGGVAGSSSLQAGSTAVDAGEGGQGGVAADARFVPDIEGTYVGSVIEPGLEIIAHSIAEGPLGHEWLVALENTSADLRLCAITMDTTFLDASGAEVASATLGLVRAPLKRGCSGSCGYMNCINPGEIGMMVHEYGIEDADVDRIASYTYSFGALDIVDAVPSSDVTVTSLEVFTDALDATRYRGMFVNNTSTAFGSGDIAVFGLNGVGRPLFGVTDFTGDTIPAFSSWSFETRRFVVPLEDVASLAAFPEVTEP